MIGNSPESIGGSPKPASAPQPMRLPGIRLADLLPGAVAFPSIGYVSRDKATNEIWLKNDWPIGPEHLQPGNLDDLYQGKQVAVLRVLEEMPDRRLDGLVLDCRRADYRSFSSTDFGPNPYRAGDVDWETNYERGLKSGYIVPLGISVIDASGSLLVEGDLPAIQPYMDMLHEQVDRWESKYQPPVYIEAERLLTTCMPHGHFLG